MAVIIREKLKMDLDMDMELGRELTQKDSKLISILEIM